MTEIYHECLTPASRALRTHPATALLSEGVAESGCKLLPKSPTTHKSKSVSDERELSRVTTHTGAMTGARTLHPISHMS